MQFRAAFRKVVGYYRPRVWLSFRSCLVNFTVISLGFVPSVFSLCCLLIHKCTHKFESTRCLISPCLMQVLAVLQQLQRAPGQLLQQRAPRQLQGTLPVYDLVEYIGTSGSSLTSADIGKFPLPPSNVKLTWVVAFIGDATSSSTPSRKFGCTGGSFCSGSGLDQGLISALKGVSNAKLLTPCCLLPSFCCKSYM